MNRDHESSVFNLQENIVILCMWLLLLIAIFVFDAKLFFIGVPLFILVIEKKSQLVRDHAGQALVYYIIAFIVIRIIFSAVIAIVSFIYISFMSSLTITGFNFWNIAGYAGGFFPITVLQILLSISKIIFCILPIIGMIKGYRFLHFDLPVISQLGRMAAEKIKP